jgi:para-nitrobenzyl esterase
MPGFVLLAAYTVDIQFLFPLGHGGPLGNPHRLNARDQHVSDQMVNFWTNSVAMGNLNEHNNKPWPEYPGNEENLASYLVQDMSHFSMLTRFKYSARYQCHF